MKTRVTVLAPYALAFACLFVFGLTTLAMAGAGSGSTGPGGGCPVATSTSPGCVTLGQVTSEPSYTATGTAPQWICSLATSTCEMDSPTDDATTSGTVGAFTLKATVAHTAADLLFDVQTSAAVHAISVTEQGDLQVPSSGSIGVSATGSGCGLFQGTGKNLSFSGSSSGCAAGVFMATGSGSGPLKLAIGGANKYAWSSTEFQPDADLGVALGGTANRWLTFYAGPNIATTCTLNGGTPSTCTKTVVANAICTCTPVGGTAVIAAGGCAVGLSGTTLTATGPAAAAYVVNIHCINPS